MGEAPSRAAVSCRDVSLMGTVFAKEEEKVVLLKNGDRELNWPLRRLQGISDAIDF